MTFERGNCAGRFTRFRIPANLVTRRGRRMRGSTAGRRTTGREWLSMPSAELFTCRRDRRRLISTAANRVGDDLFANCLIALNAETGERIWHFQGVRHDLWDRDFPSPPTLVTVNRDGKEIDAVAQTTKQGFVYLFDRVSGKPLFPIEYSKYPPSNVPGRSCRCRTAAAN